MRKNISSRFVCGDCKTKKKNKKISRKTYLSSQKGFLVTILLTSVKSFQNNNIKSAYGCIPTARRGLRRLRELRAKILNRYYWLDAQVSRSWKGWATKSLNLSKLTKLLMDGTSSHWQQFFLWFFTIPGTKEQVYTITRVVEDTGKRKPCTQIRLPWTWYSDPLHLYHWMPIPSIADLLPRFSYCKTLS